MAKRNLFNSIKLSKPKRSVFDLTHDVKLSLNMGDLVPIMNEPCLPGDKWSISCETLMKLAPMIAPIMHRVDVTVHYFFVPYRILWPNWESFITGPKNDGPYTPPAHPTVLWDVSALPVAGKLGSYLGLPTPLTGVLEPISAFPWAAYQRIYNEFYRDQNLSPEIPSVLIDGDNSTDWSVNGMGAMRQRCWEHDYFTGALPWAQKGATVDLPLGTFATPDIALRYSDSSGLNAQWTATPSNQDVENEISVGLGDNVLYTPGVELDTQSTTINDLRRATKLQMYLEKAARVGSRYVENLMGVWNTFSGDARLNRPEYITGVKSPVIISEVLNTAGQVTESVDPPTNPLPQGNMSGNGMAVASGQYGSYSCKEHGLIMGIMSVLPKTGYQQGLNRHWSKSDYLDYAIPDFDHLGEQEILNKEIYIDAAAPDDTFGYVPRYAEYKYACNRVAGEFQTSLNFWHMSRIFSETPALNHAFVTSNPTNRIFAVEDPDADHLYCHCLNKITVVRSLSKYSTPGGI